ncbi:hypothetical protein [Antiquaquibacter soli]|uniref:Uncharacterized protein n=1 Tax=Antiquaquibacter soli TaxID=3064523 RepID=A0ABT9BP83_9MICO|nr:hypothetical protein [Protaetiibacter sp. WY-16]MDO7882829.1 hypothetical protein [Protaetiibacter sp. WY-16]
MNQTEADERFVLPEERIDLDAGFGRLRLTERRRDFEAGRSGGLGMALESLLRGVSNLR